MLRAVRSRAVARTTELPPSSALPGAGTQSGLRDRPFGIVAPDNLRSAETCSGEGRVPLDSLAHIRLDRARRSPQNNLAIFRQSDSQPVCASDDRKSTRLNSSHMSISYA